MIRIFSVFSSLLIALMLDSILIVLIFSIFSSFLIALMPDSSLLFVNCPELDERKRVLLCLFPLLGSDE